MSFCACALARTITIKNNQECAIFSRKTRRSRSSTVPNQGLHLTSTAERERDTRYPAHADTTSLPSPPAPPTSHTRALAASGISPGPKEAGVCVRRATPASRAWCAGAAKTPRRLGPTRTKGRGGVAHGIRTMGDRGSLGDDGDVIVREGVDGGVLGREGFWSKTRSSRCKYGGSGRLTESRGKGHKANRNHGRSYDPRSRVSGVREKSRQAAAQKN